MAERSAVVDREGIAGLSTAPIDVACSKELPPMLAVVPLVLALAHAAPASPDAIVGGEPVEPGEHPAVVSVSAGGGLCTGTLLAPDLVLTAAHCLDQGFLQPSQVQIGLGEDALA